MNADEQSKDNEIRFAAGETDRLPPAPRGSRGDDVSKDTTYSPSSEAETREKQKDEVPGGVDDDIDPDDVKVAPGTGGPDDVGDVHVDPDDLNMPGRS